MLTQKGYATAYMEVNDFRKERRKHNIGTWYDNEGVTWKMEWLMEMIDNMSFDEMNKLEIEMKEKRNARWRQSKIARKNGQRQTSHTP